MIIAAYIALVVLTLLAVFQIALIFGAPIGRFAWGGQHRVLPLNLRLGSLLSLVLYDTFGLFLMSKAGIWELIQDEQMLQIGLWVFTVYFALGVIMNGISRSKPERYVMTPVAAVLFICFLIVALG